MKKILTLALAAASLCYAGSVSAQCPDPATPAIPADDVVSLLSGSYTQATGFNIGGWGQSTVAEEVTAANGAPVYHITNFNYLGWEFHQHINVEGFDYMHVEFYPETQTPFGFTPISPAQEKPFIASDVKVGEWNSYDVPLTHWDNVKFNDLFQVKFDQGNGGSGYIANVYFWKDNRVIPAITANVSDIAMDGAVINFEVTLPEQLEGADVKVLLNGETEISSPYALTGLTPSTDYKYSLKAIATLNDASYESDEVNISFTTLRDPSNTPMWYGHCETDTKNNNMEKAVHLTFDYTMIANADNTLTIEAIVGGDYESLPGLVGFQINVLGEANEWGDPMFPDENGMISRTTTRTFTDGEQLTGFFWVPYALNSARVDFAEPYKYGSENEKPVTAVKPRLTASVEDITATGASIVYTVDMPAELAGAELKVLLNGETELSESPYILSGLTENTQYDYTIQAIATLNGETYESLEQPISFKTLRDGAKAVSNYQIVDFLLTDAYKIGEEVSMKRSIPVSSKVELIYNTDKTITANFTVSGEADVVGFTYEICIGDEYSRHLNDKAVDGIYSYTTTKTFEEGENLVAYMWFGHAGGVNRGNLKEFKVGESCDPVAYGELAGVELVATTTDVAANVATPVTYYAVDAAGHYLLNEEIALNVKEGDATINGDFVTLPVRGTAVIEAVCGDFSAELTFNCLTSADATNVAKGVLGVASEAATTDPAKATDDNESDDSMLIFNCADTEEHSFALDLGKNHDIEVIEIVFEGASATQYTITVERETPDAPAARAKAESKVYEVTDGQGGGGLTVRKQFVEDTPVVGRYVTLNTSKAFDKTWGIKLKELRVLGKESANTPTGIESVELEAAAPARYFRLDGIEVSAEQLSAGVYVKLQGNTASKIVVR